MDDYEEKQRKLCKQSEASKPSNPRDQTTASLPGCCPAAKQVNGC